MADNPLRKKVGPLEVWQYLTIGTGAGLMLYLYKKKHAEGKEVNPEEEEKLLGGLSKGGGGGGGEGAGVWGDGQGSGNLGVPGVEGPKGQEGIAGPAGDQGPAGEAPSAGLEAQVNALQEDLAKNQPPSAGTHNGAAQATPKGWTKNAKGELYRQVIKGDKIVHEYKDRKGPKKNVVVGKVHKPAPPKKRKKPTPIQHRVVAKGAPAKKTPAKEKHKPVHR
jgi:hypothetical protein